MLVQYTPISSLTPEQRQRLQFMANGIQTEGLSHIMFEGMAISKAELASFFQSQGRPKQPGQPLFG